MGKAAPITLCTAPACPRRRSNWNSLRATDRGMPSTRAFSTVQATLAGLYSELPVEHGRGCRRGGPPARLLRRLVRLDAPGRRDVALTIGTTAAGRWRSSTPSRGCSGPDDSLVLELVSVTQHVLLPEVSMAEWESSRAPVGGPPPGFTAPVRPGTCRSWHRWAAGSGLRSARLATGSAAWAAVRVRLARTACSSPKSTCPSR